MTSTAATRRLSFGRRLPRIGAIAAIMLRDLSIARSYRIVVAFDLVFVVVNLTLFYFISKTFDGTNADLGAAPTYFAFAAVGIAITAVIETASTGLAERIREEQLTGTLEVLVAQPLTLVELALGLAAFPYVSAMARAALYLLVATFGLGLDVGDADWIGFVAVLVAAAAAFAGLGIAAGAVVLVVKRGQFVVGIVTFALGLVSGALFPISVLPAWIRPLGEVAPPRFALDAMRAALFEGDGWTHGVLILGAYAVVAFPLGMLAFRRALTAVRRGGSLSEY
jgi:ABC-2 type transport system permease protein